MPKTTPRDFNARLFEMRLERSRDDLFGMLERLYGHRPDYERFSADLVATLRGYWEDRPDTLKWRDMERDLEPDWFQRPDMNGYVFYIDRFAGTLDKVPDKLDYLEDLGITYVHFMPCLKPRPGDSDGGYSVMDYTEVNPALGTMDDLEATTAACHARGMSVCIDLVLNHTAKEHEWAQKARAGDGRYRDYYFMFPDDMLPKAYESTLVEIFPANAPGNFTYYQDMDRWVWTTFNEHQWDLNWSNPQVFLEMIRVMLFLANKGVDILRLDAPAFLWKRMGTRCQSEPEVHVLLHALRAATRIAAPAVIHLEEAIVGPAEMIPYLGRGIHAGKEGNLAYHNSLMVQFWSSLAARDTALMSHVLRTHFPPTLANATYATYLRCHDDIGWAVTDEDAGAVGISGFGHRTFLSDFYDGTFAGSFARGALFQVNETTGDKRISGSAASLAGLEQAIEAGDGHEIDTAIDRILMGHALIAAWGGIPLIYMGDEIALLNDYGYTEVPEHAHDSRWIHRPEMDWDRVAGLDTNRDAPHARVFEGIRHILARRTAVPGFHGAVPTEVLDTGRDGVFALPAAPRPGPWSASSISPKAGPACPPPGSQTRASPGSTTCCPTPRSTAPTAGLPCRPMHGPGWSDLNSGSRADVKTQPPAPPANAPPIPVRPLARGVSRAGSEPALAPGLTPFPLGPTTRHWSDIRQAPGRPSFLHPLRDRRLQPGQPGTVVNSPLSGVRAGRALGRIEKLGAQLVPCAQSSRVQAGPGGRYLRDQTGADTTELAAIASSRFHFLLTDGVFLTNDTDVLYSDTNTLATNDVGVTFKMSERLSTRGSYRTEWNSDPLPGFEEFDNTIGLSLVYGF